MKPISGFKITTADVIAYPAQGTNRATISGLTTGEYNIAIEANGFVGESRKVYVDSDMEIQFVLSRANLLTDPRDGQTYRTVLMPDGRVWMAENLNYNQLGSVNNPDYGDIYGRLYTWEQAMSAATGLDGWRVPTDAEWQTLIDACGGVNVAGGKLKSTSGWYNNGNGTDDYNFSALPGGHGYGGKFYYFGSHGFWWSATESGSNYGANAWTRSTVYNLEYVNRTDSGKSSMFSLRLIKHN